MSAWLQVLTVVVVLGVLHVPLGNHLARTFSATGHLRVERVIYRLVRVDPDADQQWRAYAGSLIAFSAVSVLGLYALLRLQPHLPLAGDAQAMSAPLAFNTSISFVSNTSWQSYSGESLGHLAQMAGLGVAAFTSAAVGLGVALALVRGLAREGTDRVGNFWTDLVRASVRVLLPIAAAGSLLMLAGGVVQTLAFSETVTTLSGGTQEIRLGPLASFEPIRLVSGDGGGFFNANASHPFSNPNPLTGVLQVVLMLLVPSAIPRMFGILVGSRRQGRILLGVMVLLWASSVAAITAAEVSGRGTVPASVGASMEGKEVRFGVAQTALFAATSTATADGAANGSYDSFTALGGGAVLANMMLGEISPGGVGTGLIGILVLALLSVFLAGLMVGRTPSYLGKRLGPREITLVALQLLAVPAVLLGASALAIALPQGRASMQESGAHGSTELLYMFTSASYGNGSAFAGVDASTDFATTSLGIAMLIGRWLPLVLTLALAGTLGAQRRVTVPAGSVDDQPLLFGGLVTVVALLFGLLGYFPLLALGPLGEAL